MPVLFLRKKADEHDISMNGVIDIINSMDAKNTERDEKLSRQALKDTEHDKAIEERIAKDHEQDEQIKQQKSKDLEHDRAILEGIEKDKHQDTLIGEQQRINETQRIEIEQLAEEIQQLKRKIYCVQRYTRKKMRTRPQKRSRSFGKMR